MALRILPTVRTTGHLKSHPSSTPVATASSCRKRPFFASITASGLKQKKRDPNISYSPLQTAEDLASLLGLEMTVAGLERLFREAGRRPPDVFGSPGRPIRVAYQGIQGSYCQEAASKSFPSVACESFSCSHMEDAFLALEDGSADRAVVPAENSLDGPIDRNLDLLLRHPGVRIVGELVLPVNHCLLSVPGVQKSDIRRVVSHPQALSHCEERLRALNLEVEEVSNAADAARFVAENRITDTAVIGSKIAAREFGLRVLEQNLQGKSGNFNRFLQLGLGVGPDSSKPIGAGDGSRKTTVAFTLERGVSDLFRAMWIFENRGFGVTRVEQRPNRSKPVRVVEREEVGEVTYLDYVFILDLEGNESDTSLDVALARLREIAGLVRVLGSYTCIHT